LTREIFLKNGGNISANSFDESKSLILTDIIFSLFNIAFYCKGFKEGSSA
jgi:hypothetical protein